VLANKLGDYVVRLLDKVHGNDELNAILNAGDGGSDDPCRPHGKLARLQLAIDYKEKKVRSVIVNSWLARCRAALILSLSVKFLPLHDVTF